MSGSKAIGAKAMFLVLTVLCDLNKSLNVSLCFLALSCWLWKAPAEQAKFYVDLKEVMFAEHLVLLVSISHALLSLLSFLFFLPSFLPSILPSFLSYSLSLSLLWLFSVSAAFMISRYVHHCQEVEPCQEPGGRIEWRWKLWRVKDIVRLGESVSAWRHQTKTDGSWQTLRTLERRRVYGERKKKRSPLALSKYVKLNEDANSNTPSYSPWRITVWSVFVLSQSSWPFPLLSQ